VLKRSYRTAACDRLTEMNVDRWTRCRLDSLQLACRRYVEPLHSFVLAFNCSGGWGPGPRQHSGVCQSSAQRQTLSLNNVTNSKIFKVIKTNQWWHKRLQKF